MLERPTVTVVAPVYRNRTTVAALLHRLDKTMAEADLDFEILYVDDACPDGSGPVLDALATEDPRVGVVHLRDNGGQQHALIAGISRARGHWVVTMDADLQDPPEAVPALIRAGESADAVFAARRGRYQSVGRLVTSRLYKTLLSRITPVPADAGAFVAMRHGLVQEILSLRAASIALVPLIGLTDCRIATVPVVRAERTEGSSAYLGSDRLRAGLNALACVTEVRLGWSSVRVSDAGAVPARLVGSPLAVRTAYSSSPRAPVRTSPPDTPPG